jgi:hypothetical protein
MILYDLDIYQVSKKAYLIIQNQCHQRSIICSIFTIKKTTCLFQNLDYQPI